MKARNRRVIHIVSSYADLSWRDCWPGDEVWESSEYSPIGYIDHNGAFVHNASGVL